MRLRYGTHDDQRAELELPDGDGPFPVVALVHGGYWRARYGAELMDALAADVVRRGWAALNIEYRRLGGGGSWPGLLEDVLAALATLGSVADPRVDLGRVALVGHSAGGHLALLAAAARPESVVGVVAQAPVTDLVDAFQRNLSDGAAALLTGTTPERDPAVYRRASPVARLPLGVPILVVHGDADDDVPVEQGRRFAELAQQAGDEVEYVELPGGDHMGHIDPASEAWAVEAAWLERRFTATADAEGQSPALTYTSYLRIDELLELQTPLSDGPEHDEMLFIVIHQVYELWFRQLLHELEGLQRALEAGDVGQALHLMKRILTILKTVVAQIDVLETMTPRSFASFRGRLERASGFQSAQFRELEAVLGRREPKVLEHHAAGRAHARLVAALERPPLYHSYLVFLHGQGHPIPPAVLARDPRAAAEPSEELQDVLVQVYADDPVAAQVSERLVDIDEGFQEWRYRHVKMVERTIGMRVGTGGSSGAEYLRQTLFRPAFPDLWAIRSRF